MDRLILVLQLTWNGLGSGALFAMSALGFALILFVLKILHFAHASVVNLVAYMIFGASVLVGVPWPIGVLVGLLSAAAVGLMVETTFYRPLRKTAETGVPFFIVSLGVLLLITNLLPLYFGTSTVFLESGIQAGAFLFLDDRLAISHIDLLAFLLVWVVAGGVFLWLNRSRMGRALRAMMDDPATSAIVGIPLNRYYLLAMAIGSGLTVPVAVIILMQSGVNSQLGESLMLVTLTAVIVGGLGSLRGAILGGFLVGLVRNLGLLILPSSFGDAVTFTTLLFFIALRPQGLLGKRFTAYERPV